MVCESRPTALAASLTSEHQLADRSRVLVRPVLYSDRYALADGYRTLSEEGRRLRFFSAPSALSDADLEYLTKLDYYDHFAWAAFAVDEASSPGIAVARYIRDPKRPTQAEAAVTVLDAYQHRGLGTLLLLMLADRARANGVHTFVSYILWDNREILATLKEAGARVEPEEPGVARVEIDIPDPETAGLADVVRAALKSFGRAARVLLGVERAAPEAVGGPPG